MFFYFSPFFSLGNLRSEFLLNLLFLALVGFFLISLLFFPLFLHEVLPNGYWVFYFFPDLIKINSVSYLLSFYSVRQ